MQSRFKNLAIGTPGFALTTIEIERLLDLGSLRKTLGGVRHDLGELKAAVTCSTETFTKVDAAISDLDARLFKLEQIKTDQAWRVPGGIRAYPWLFALAYPSLRTPMRRLLEAVGVGSPGDLAAFTPAKLVRALASENGKRNLVDPDEVPDRTTCEVLIEAARQSGGPLEQASA